MHETDVPLRPSESPLVPLREQPQLLLQELLWRWSCGGLLLAVATYDALRLWRVYAPPVRATGLLGISGDSLLADPSAALASLSATYALLRPPVERAALGLAPLAIFCWVIAFALGRTAVLAQWDVRLVRRPWLIAGVETARIGLVFGVSAIWSLLADGAARVALGGDAPNPLLYGALLLAATVGCLWIWMRCAQALQMAMALALVDQSLNFQAAFLEGWHLRPPSLRVAVRAVRRRAGRAGWLLLLVALLASLIPSPAAGILHYAWWMLWTLAFLAATDAVRLGLQLALLGIVREAWGKRESAAWR